MTEVEEWRSDQIKQANMFLEWCSDRDDHTAQELRSIAHDVISARRDRDYRRITAFFKDLPSVRMINVRSFDLRTREAG